MIEQRILFYQQRCWKIIQTNSLLSIQIGKLRRVVMRKRRESVFFMQSTTVKPKRTVT